MLRRNLGTSPFQKRRLDDELVCPPPVPCVCNETTSPEKIQIKLLVPELGYANFKSMLDRVAIEYRRVKGQDVEVLVKGVDSITELQNEVIFDAKNKQRQFDGYIINPIITGELSSNDGLFDLSEFIKNYDGNPSFWLDVLLFYRDILSTYDSKILLMPFDGDVFSLYYRKDLFDQHNISVPKTWDEYIKVANFFHGMPAEIFNATSGKIQNGTLAGSCIGRAPGCGGAYWAQSILASMTQYSGTDKGSLLDTKDLSPLLGPAMEETLRILEEQAKVGTSDEFDGCVGINVQAMNRGECAITYNWGNSFTEHVADGSVVRGKLGVADVPGSPYILNRTSGNLENCTLETCPFAVEHTDDDGNVMYVNQAPYAAYAGWSGAVSNNVSPEHRIAAAEFLAFASDSTQAIQYVIPDRTQEVIPTGMDPYRKSLLQLNKWVDRDYPEDATRNYLDAIQSQLSSENVVADIRFPTAPEILGSLDEETFTYLQDTIVSENPIPAEERAQLRRDISAKLASSWRKSISDYDAKDTTTTPLLEIYQKLRGVYSPPEPEIPRGGNDKDLGSAAIAGISVTVFGTVVFSAIFIAFLIIRQDRKKREENSWYINPSDIIDTGEVLGKGSFGIVTKGFLRGSAVALKKPHIEDSADLDVKEVEADPTMDTTRFSGSGMSNASKSHPLRKELQTLIQLRHPNVVETLGATIIDNEMIIILEYMEHNTIRKVLKNPDGMAGTAIMSVEIQWALQVARGLSFLHSFPAPYGPLLHNDLKSSNVLVDGSFNAHISDFGLASKTMKGLWGWLNKSQTPKGSVLFMAPEVLHGHQPSPASDVYSFAMFLCELMTRGRPYNVKAYSNKQGTRDREFSWSMHSGGEHLDSSKDGSKENDNELNGSDLDLVDFDISQSSAVDEPELEETLAIQQIAEIPITEDPVTRKTGRRVSFSSRTSEESEKEPDDSSKSRRRNSLASAGNSNVSSKGCYEFLGTVGGEMYTREEIIEKVKDLTLDPPFRPDIPDDAPQVLRDICIECWHKNPKRRPTMHEIEERLDAVVSNETVAQQLMRRGSMFDTILPRDVQDTLARGESVPPVPYEDASMIFSDIVEFTKISSVLTAEEVGDLIGRLLSQFDTLCRQHNVKKLDIIGDAFIGVAGVPTMDPFHARKAATFALDAIECARRTLICPSKPHLGYVQVRFGIATGSVVATVIGGSEHPKYTLFGDTVNTASRMETTSEPNRCQCTEVTAKILKDIAPEIDIELRGNVDIKGKGTMETYWIKGIKDNE